MSYEDLGYNALLTITKPANSQITEKNNLAMVADGTIDYDQTTLGTIRTKQGIQSANYIPGISGWKIYGNGAAEFQLIASKGYIHVYSQDTEPTGGTYYQGDLWYDTNDGNKRYVYKGGAWIVDESISAWSQIVDDDGHKPDNDATYGATWNTNISGQPSDSAILNPSYITSTKITSTTIESPTITAGTITGSTLQTRTTGANVNITSDTIELRNGTTVTGRITGNDGTGISNVFADVVTVEIAIMDQLQTANAFNEIELRSDILAYYGADIDLTSGTLTATQILAKTGSSARLRLPVGTNLYS